MSTRINPNFGTLNQTFGLEISTFELFIKIRAIKNMVAKRVDRLARLAASSFLLLRRAADRVGNQHDPAAEIALSNLIWWHSSWLRGRTTKHRFPRNLPCPLPRTDTPKCITSYILVGAWKPKGHRWSGLQRPGPKPKRAPMNRLFAARGRPSNPIYCRPPRRDSQHLRLIKATCAPTYIFVNIHHKIWVDTTGIEYKGVILNTIFLVCGFVVCTRGNSEMVNHSANLRSGICVCVELIVSQRSWVLAEET